MSADRGGGRRATLAAWQDIERHFEAVVLLAEEERRAYLERECGGDADLEAAVQELLDADAKAPTFFEQGALHFAAGAVDDRPASDAEDRSAVSGDLETVGGYRLLEEIGRGGMSRVFAAEQEDDRLRRRVALKRMTTIGRLREESEHRFLAMTPRRRVASCGRPDLKVPKSVPASRARRRSSGLGRVGEGTDGPEYRRRILMTRPWFS